MAKSQENGTKILLDLKGYKVGKVIEEESDSIGQFRLLVIPESELVLYRQSGSTLRRSGPKE